MQLVSVTVVTLFAGCGGGGGLGSTLIAFFSDRTGTGEIWVMNGNGTNQTQLTTGGSVTALSFAPNGVWLAYAQNGDIWRLTWSGSSWGSPVQLTTTGNNFTPCWTPDSLQIIFMSLRTGNAEIWRTRFDGTGQTNLTNDPSVDENPRCAP